MRQWGGDRSRRARDTLGIGLAVLLLGAVAIARAADPADDGLVDPPPAGSGEQIVPPRAADPPAQAGPASGRAPAVVPIPARTTSVIANYPAQIDVPAGQSAVVRLRRPAQRVAIADPEVADVVLVSPTEILVNGRGRRYNLPSGEPVVQEAQTSLIVWDKDGQADVRALYVNRSRMEQVELHVTVAELNRSAIEAQGFDFQVLAGGVTVTGTPAKVASLTALADALIVSPDRVTFAVQDPGNFQAFIELMEREGLAKVLARPTIMARSGEEAHFRSGGEVPIALVTANTTAVQFKEFGVIVTFTPTFTADGLIDLRVEAELSAPVRSRGIVVSGSAVPEFISRQASTRVRLRDRQSLMIAGLLRDDETEDERKVPYLGDLPYLGALFRSTSFEHTKSELVILVQPEVSKMGRDDGEMALPTARGPLTRAEVRTRPTPNVVSRPRVFGCARRPCAGGESPVSEAH